jgi:hypothetical protein
MKKIAIATIFHVCNYGTVLQAYATQNIIRQLGYDSEIIRYIPERVSARRAFLASGASGTKNFLRYAASVLVRLPGNMIMRKVFDDFTKNHLTFTESKYENAEQAEENPPNADAFLTGSDQVWNSKYNEGIDPIYYLDFVPTGKKRVAYAASIGGEDFEVQEKAQIRYLLGKYDALSVREKSAQQAILALGIEKVQQVLDPTLLLSVERWSKLFSKRKVADRYLLLYILGRDKTLVDIGEAIAKDRGLKIVKIGLDFILSAKVDKNDLFCTPNEFLSYFYYADYVITNSFHGLSFILNFNKQFSIVLPKTFSTRLESPLCQFGLEDRIITDACDLDRQKEWVDYGLVLNKFEKAKEDSLLFFKKALA